jgi:NAD(P)-dependent dehydrogenase (short-subunit alcohol dehydrogenase family)
MARQAIPLMLKTGSGSMVHFSSVQAYRGDPLPQDAYSQSKAAVLNLSKSIAMQFAKDNIRSNTIVPGMTMTPLQKRWENDNDSKDKMAEYIPLKRLGTPADMADGVLFLLSQASSFITGTELIIDGGILLH